MSSRCLARCLEDVLDDEKSFRGRRLQDVLKTCLEDVLKTSLEDLLKTCLEDVLKTSLEDLLKTCLEDVLKTNKCLLGCSFKLFSKEEIMTGAVLSFQKLIITQVSFDVFLIIRVISNP